MKNYILLCVFLLSFLFLSLQCHSQKFMNNGGEMSCEYWINKIDPSTKNSNIEIDRNLSDQIVLEAIECLLKCKGNKNLARFTGTTHPHVSQILPEATIELAALYYISYLYLQRWEHADGIAFWNDKGKINPEGYIEDAYKSYTEWFLNVKSIGISKSREEKLDPLKGSGLVWYGN